MIYNLCFFIFIKSFLEKWIYWKKAVFKLPKFLYNIIFDVENTNTTAEYLEYRDEFKHFLAKKNILDNISTIKALFGLNRKQKVDWELDLNELGKSLLELVVNYDYE